MMRTIACLLFPIATVCSAQQYLGVQTWGGTSSDQLNALALDAQGRLFAVGGLRNTADLDPGPGNWPLTATGGQDIFLSRFTADAQFEWSVRLGGTEHDHSQALAVHTDGLFVGGEFADTLVAGATQLVANGSSDALLAHYDLDGALLWVLGTGGTGSDYITDVAVDAAGNVIAIGYFQGTVDLDPGPAVLPVSAGGADAIFLWKLTAAGDLVWVRTWNGTSSENGLAVAVGSAGDVWMGGGYFGTLDLDPGAGSTPVTAPGFDQNAFLIHLDSDGAFLFGGHVGGDGSDVVHDLKLDAEGAVIAVGTHSATGDFDPGAGTMLLPHVGGPDSFVLKCSATGQLLHAAAVGSAGYDQPRAVELGPDGGIMLTGGFDGNMDLDPGPGSAPFVSNGVADVYVLLLDSALHYMEGAAWGGTGLEDGTALAWSTQGRRFAGGLFEYAVDFDPGPGTDIHSSLVNSRDAFLTRLCTPRTEEHAVTIAIGDSLFVGGAWQQEEGTYTDVYTASSGCDSLIITHLTVDINTALEEREQMPALRVHPVPAQEWLTITRSTPAQGRLEIRDASGRLVQHVPMPHGTVHTIPMGALAPGMYSARLSGAPGLGVVFIKER